jgi:hypothetical protein
MAVRRALVLGGTGMLTRVTTGLIRDGWHVVLPSRRYAPLAAEGTGRALWVEADWSYPERLADRAARALGGPADLLVAWVDGRARVPVLRAVARLLTPTAPVVEVHGSASANPIAGCPDPVIGDHQTQQVILRAVTEHGTTRWLTQSEIAASVADAIRRALDGRVSGIHQVGGVRVS